jgi:hypothetical protein
LYLVTFHDEFTTTGRHFTYESSTNTAGSEGVIESQASTSSSQGNHCKGPDMLPLHSDLTTDAVNSNLFVTEGSKAQDPNVQCAVYKGTLTARSMFPAKIYRLLKVPRMNSQTKFLSVNLKQ